MGLKDDQLGADNDNMDKLMELVINLRNQAKQNKDYAIHVLGDNLDIIVGANEIFKAG